MKPMDKHKQVCNDLAKQVNESLNLDIFDRFEYGGYWDNHYHFHRGNHSKGFVNMLCLEEDLTIDNLIFMAKNKLTRIMGFNYGS